MLARGPHGEQPLLDRCTRRYGLLEELLGPLAEGGVDPRTMRGCLEQVDADPSRYRRLGTALADALASDRSCERWILVLARSSLPAKLRAFLASRHAELKRSGPLPQRAGVREVTSTSGRAAGIHARAGFLGHLLTTKQAALCSGFTSDRSGTRLVRGLD